jgi:hypothetical protein
MSEAENGQNAAGEKSAPQKAAVPAVTDSAGSKSKKKKEDEPQPIHLKTKSIPAIVMLAGGLVSAVCVFVRQTELQKALVIIFVSLLAFLVVGDIIKIFLDRIELLTPEMVDADGNVIEKGKSEEEPGEESEGMIEEENPEVGAAENASEDISTEG